MPACSGINKPDPFTALRRASSDALGSSGAALRAAASSLAASRLVPDTGCRRLRRGLMLVASLSFS
ncbi:MAG: hypothetical protein AB7E47_05145 [Desulfovibrionaceae bacterium]